MRECYKNVKAIFMGNVGDNVMVYYVASVHLLIAFLMLLNLVKLKYCQ